MSRRILFLVLVPVTLALAQQGARYLIIATDQLAAAIQPLADWKHASGMQCKVARTSETGSDTTSIKNYIRNAYNTWPVKPEYVLLVGSPSSLPARIYTIQHVGTYASDNIYGDVTGDFRMDIPVGRFPAKSPTQLEVMVAKTLAYETKPELSDSNWMRRMTTICRDLGDDDAWVYWNDVRNAINLARNAGFVGFDSLASSLGDTAPDVVASINNGTGMVLYRGTATNNWYKPFAVDPGQTANGRKLPIILSITCETMTLTPNESMVGEAWLKTGTSSNPRGAVAFFGNTHSGSNVAQVRSAVARGFFTGLFTENKYKLGHAMIRAKEQLYQEYPSYTADYRGFNLLGDPDLGIWTATPRILEVSHPQEILPQPQQIQVTVRSKLTPIANALVCASMGSAVYTYGYTNSSGEVTLSVSPSDTGSMRLVVTGQNCYPYDGTIHVVTQVGLAEHPPVPACSPKLSATPSAFLYETRLSWPPVRDAGLTVAIHDACGRLVRTLSGSGSSAVWDGCDQDGRRLGPGVYVCTLLAQSTTSLSRTSVTKLK
ncbi:MAG: C25 family cysteine peptidase [candidate division WOR-3 bacterium]